MTTDTTKATANVTVPCQFCATQNRVDLGRLEEHPKCGACDKPILLDRPIKVEESQFDATVLKASVPVLVDFYADWCGPCRMAPHLDDLAHRERGRVLVVKVDTDRSPGLAMRYNVRGIPYLARFEQGKLVRSSTGSVGADGLNDLMA